MEPVQTNGLTNVWVSYIFRKNWVNLIYTLINFIQLKKISNIEVLGPVDSPLLKIKKKFRSRLLLRFGSGILVQKKITNLLNSLKISSKIKLTVDVDPVNFS